MPFLPGASTTHIGVAKKYSFITVGQGLGEGWEDSQGLLVNPDMRWY